MHRGWQEHPVFEKEPFTEREAWEWIIASAAYENRTINIKGSPVKLGRGQLSYSIRFMANAWQWKPVRVQRFLKKINRWNMICSKSDTGQNVITVCNYRLYQDGKVQSDTGAIQERYRSDTNNKEVKEVKELKERKNIHKPENVTQDTWKDFLLIRESKKAKVTQTALNAIQREADKANWTLEEALKEIITRNWQGFKAEWVKAKPQPDRETSLNKLLMEGRYDEIPEY